MNSRELIAARVAQELSRYGSQPRYRSAHLVTKYLPEGIILQSENGMLNMGPPAPEGQADPYICDAGGKKVTLLPGMLLTVPPPLALFGVVMWM